MEWWQTLQSLIPHFYLALSLLWAGYLVVLGGWILLQKREPVATLSWLLVLALLPVLGFIVYYWLGPLRIRRQQLKRLRSRSGLTPALPDTFCRDHDDAGMSRLIQAMTTYGPSSARELRLLVGGDDTFAAVLAAIAAAEHHIHLEYYIFEPDRTGTRVRDALVARARVGVRVRLLLDAVGSAHCNEAFLAPLRAAGADLAWFHPLRLGRLRLLRRPRYNLRNHRKLLLIDGALAFTGGVNITDDESRACRADAHHDLHLSLRGEVVRWLQLAFVEDWHYATGVALRDEHLWPTAEPGRAEVQVIPSGPDNDWEPIHRALVESLHQARFRIWLATPYFVPGEAARMALTSAALRGLDVRVLVPEQSDSRIVTFAARSYYDELVRAGVRVFEYRQRMLHSKAVLVDNDQVHLGSANFDHRSFRLNFELNVWIRDSELAASLAQAFGVDFAQSREFRSGGRRGRGLGRLAEAGARLLSPLL